MNADKPLEPGEHLDIDGDQIHQVRRSANVDDEVFLVKGAGDNRLVLTAADIRTLAELAGVIDDEIP